MAEDFDLKMMVADYMERGFLENIIDMFRHDKTLYPLIGELIKDERVRVRLGVAALVETLTEEDPENILISIPSTAALLRDQNPTVRGDAAYLLGMIGHPDALPSLKEIADDEDTEVREIVRESIEEIEKKRNKI
ncbi:MAG: HEAT repeat domain-containing protein [Thermodesulfovibrionales bacterium]